MRAGYGVTFISRSAIEADLAAGTIAEARVEGLEPAREISLVRARRPRRDARRRRRSSSSRGSGSREGRPLGPRRAARPARASWASQRAAARRDARAGEPRRSPVGGALGARVPSRARRSRSSPRRAGGRRSLAVGGGSAIDTARRSPPRPACRSSSVPTTYSGAEWTTFFGVRDPERRMRGGGGGAHLAGDRLRPGADARPAARETVGTALNALAHCAEALYVRGPATRAPTRHALAGARLIADALPRVLDAPGRPRRRARDLLAARCAPARRSAGSGLALGHAMAQALGGRYGLPHGALNAICLPPALRFNARVASRHGVRRGAAAPTIRRRASRSSPRSAASRGCATSASRARTCPRSPRSWPRGRRARRTRGPASPRRRSLELLESVY